MTPIERIYYTFYTTKKEEMYFNEIKDTSKLSNSSLQNALEKLKLKTRKTKAHKYYKIHNTIPYFIKFDIKRFNSLHYNIKVPLKEFCKHLDNFSVILFGSASRGEHTKESDIDLLIIKPKKNLPDDPKIDEHLEKIIEKAKKNTAGSTMYPLNIFITNEIDLNSNDPIIIQAILSGYPIKGHQRYYEALHEIKETSLGKTISDFTPQ